VRGDIYRLRAPRGAQGHEQQGHRYCVVVQASHIMTSTWLVAPTSTSANPASIRPMIEIEDGSHGVTTCVLVEQTVAIDPERRLGQLVGRATLAEMQMIDQALRDVLDL
jgi:mRNA interferase MazF